MLDDVPRARIQLRERGFELRGARALRARLARRGRLLILDHVAVHAVAVADRRVERERIGRELEELLHALGREPGLACDLLDGRLPIQPLCELPARTQGTAYLFSDVHRQPDRASLVA